jgi:hypothetical protein
MNAAQPIKRNIAVPLDDMRYRDDLHPDVGRIGYEWPCPDCGTILRWAPLHWWGLTCDCRHWRFNISAVGMKKEGQK